jgi:glycosyltransferase involved in cell wall biosynthesis
MVIEVVRAMRSLPPNAILVVVGEGRGRPLVEEEVAALGLDGRVRLSGRVANSDLPAYYAACDIFALPDLRDFPWLAVLEAQACGRPVVTLDTQAARLTVDAGRTGLLARDLAEFRAFLGALARDRRRSREMGERGPQYVRTFHSLAVRIEQIEQMLAGETAEAGQ